MTNQPPTNPDNYIACSHLLSTKYFLIWRLVLLLYFWALWIGVQFVKTYEVNIYFTYWTLLLSSIYLSLSCYATYLYHKQLYIKCIKYCQYSQRIQTLICATSVTVTIVFWALLFTPKTLSDPFDIQAHGVTMILILIDCFISYNTISFKSTWYYLLTYGLLYVVWSIVFAFVASHPIYKVLNWKENVMWASIYGALIIITTLIIHALICWTNNKLMLYRMTSVNIHGINVEMNQSYQTDNMKTGRDTNTSNATKMGANLTNESIKIAEHSDDEIP